jgi:mono/diheme cytochrome c family protein
MGGFLALALLFLASQLGMAAEGEARRGAALFSGAVPFEKGGAPCLGCHGIAGLGPAGGARFGPDLTALHSDYGAEGVAAILEGLAFPSMEPIYAGRPLNEAERAALAAFFAEAASGEPVSVGAGLVLRTGVGVILLLILAAVVWRGRLRTVRRSLVEKATR